MKKISNQIVFFGSGPVAARSLELLAENFEIEAVITKPKPAHHHGDFPVISLSEKLGLKTFTAANRKELSELFSTNPVKSTLAVLIDFGIIVTKDVIDYFPLGIINSHFSLLPELRGADPITFSILSGQAKTGVSLMLIDEGMDTGKIIAQRSHAIKPIDTSETLTEDLINLSNELLKEFAPKYIAQEVQSHQQPHPNRATYSRKLTKEDGDIDWAKSAQEIEREIRAYSAWPKSRAKLAGRDVTITKARVFPGHGTPGEVRIIDKDMVVFCGADGLLIERLKPAGKNEMNAEAFINGYLK